MLKSAPYFLVYAASVAGFSVAAEPSVWEDYVRIFTLALLIVVLTWIVQTAVLYTIRWRHLGADRRTRMLPPRRIWGMALSYLVALIPSARNTVELFGQQLQWYGQPMLLGSLLFAAYWLYPLANHQRKMLRQERNV